MSTLRLPLLSLLVLPLLACPPRGLPDAGTDLDAGQEEVDAGLDAGTEVPDAGEEADAGLPPELKVTRLLPPRGASAGGTPVMLEGSGFLRDFAGSGTAAKPLTTLRIGSNPVQDFQIIDDRTIELRTPPGAAGQASVTMQNPNGRFVCNNCFTYFDELVVTGFTPRQGPLAGDTEVTLTGQGFTSDTQVLFGAFSSPRITVVSSTELKVLTPRGAAPGPVDLVVYNKNGVSTQRRGFSYLAALRVSGLTPVTGPLTGATVVTLTGSGFTGATGVQFGTLPGAAVTVVSDGELTVQTPAVGTPRAVDVVVTSPAGSWTRRGGFTYVDAGGAFAVFSVTPHVVRPGDVVTLTGQALDQGALDVTIGGEPAVVGARSFDTAQLTVPARGAASRRSDVTVLGATTEVLPAAVTWGLGLGSLSPASGPSAGGTSVTLAGTALPPALDARLGALSASAPVITGETTATFSTPAGSGGAPSTLVAWESSDPENEATLADAFTYLEPLSIGRVQPERGAIAGGTLVTVYGSGFGDSTVVKFGAFNAKDLKVVDSHTLTCRTPKANAGVVDVTVGRLTESDVLPGGFSYFDPRSISGGLSGGPLVGTVNITVLESTQGAYGTPVPGAKVVLGLDPTTPFQGFTDQRGQITFSDPALVKAQTVTVLKDFFESATVTGVNAENLTVFIARTGGGEPGSGFPPPGPPPSTISGRVAGFKSPRPLQSGESLEARVFVAQTSLYGGPPFAAAPNKSSEKWRVIQDGGEYLVLTGAGLRAVYAVLGIWRAANMSFTPVAMGVKRGITTSPDNPATGRDIIIDMPLDVAVPITIDSPVSFPGLFGPEPGFNSLYAWLELGAEGFIPNPNNFDTGLGSATSVSSASPNLVFPSFPRLDGSNFVFMNEAAGAQTYPVSYYFRRQPGNLQQGVTIGPMLPAPNLRQPAGSFTGTIAWTVDPGPVADLHNLQILRPTLAGAVTVWSMVLPGTETQVVLPQAAVDKLRREEAGNTLFVVLYSSRSPKFAYNQWTYDTLSGVSWSSYTIALSSGFTP